MLKTVLKASGILLLVALGYVGWVIIQATRTIGISPVVQSAVGPDAIKVTVTLPGTATEHEITEVRFPRAWGESLGIAAPAGFRLSPYTLEDTSDPSADDSAAWVQRSNEKELRWTGSAMLRPDTATILEFPIRSSIAGDGTMRFTYERKIGLSGQMSFFDVSVFIAGT